MFRYVPTISEVLRDEQVPAHIVAVLEERDRQLEDHLGTGERQTFSHAGVLTSAESPPWEPETSGSRLRIKFLLGTAGSTSSVLTVYVDGVSVGTVTLAAAATKGVETFDVAIAADSNLVTVAVTTLGTGAADATVQAQLLS